MIIWYADCTTEVLMSTPKNYMNISKKKFSKFSFQAHNKNTRHRWKICLNLTMVLKESCQWGYSGVSIVNIGPFLQSILVFLVLNLNSQSFVGYTNLFINEQYFKNFTFCKNIRNMLRTISGWITLRQFQTRLAKFQLKEQASFNMS